MSHEFKYCSSDVNSYVYINIYTYMLVPLYIALTHDVSLLALMLFDLLRSSTTNLLGQRWIFKVNTLWLDRCHAFRFHYSDY